MINGSSLFFEVLQNQQIHSAYIPPFFLQEFDRWLKEPGHHSSLERIMVGVEPIAETLLLSIQESIPNLHIVNA